MTGKTKIEWTEATWNPIRGCSRISPGCINCYAEKIAYRFSGPGLPYNGLIAKSGQWNGRVIEIDEKMLEPLSWKKPRTVFVNSMSDLFHENNPDETIDTIFWVMAQRPQHTFQILTKRADRMHSYLTKTNRLEELGVDVSQFPLPNVWMGVSVENQEWADKRIPLLLKTPAAVRWISAEPLLGDIDLKWCSWCGAFGNHDCYESDETTPGIDWVVVGGESGPNARPMQADWARHLRDQCIEAGTAFFFKQWGEYAPNWYTNKSGEKVPNSEWMDRMGKKSAGRTLDGRTWDQYPIANRTTRGS